MSPELDELMVELLPIGSPNKRCICGSKIKFKNCHQFKFLKTGLEEKCNFKQTDLCYCGSGLTYKNCCISNSSRHTPWLSMGEISEKMDELQKSHLNHTGFEQERNLKLANECIICGKKTIDSHTITRGRMNRVFKDNYCAFYKIRGFKVSLEKTPIRSASAFPIWCKSHDNAIFEQIDNNLDLTNNFHLDLLAYRAIGREFQIIKNAVKVEYSYYYHTPCIRFLSDLIKEYVSYKLIHYTMSRIYEGVLDQTKSKLKHKIINLRKISPLFASVLVKKDFAFYPDELTCLPIITIITDEQSMGFCIISYFDGFWNTKKFIEMIDKHEKNKTIIQYLNEELSLNYENTVYDLSRVGEELTSVDQLYQESENIKYFDCVKSIE